jgi:DNA-binding SARP family transcriptional activator
VEFRVLGPLEVVEGGRALELGGLKQRALLACLLLDANRVVSTDRLVDALWEDDPPETARKALQVYVSQLRKLVGPGRLLTKPPGYLLRVEEGELDLERFERLVGAGEYADASALWRGPPFAEFPRAGFAQADIARLEELRLSSLEEHLHDDLAAGRHTELVGELEGLVRVWPLRERLRAQLMLALYRSGRHAEALDTYQDGRRRLVDELGIEPSRELRDLQQAILRQDAVLDFVAPARRAHEAERGVFVGRDRELEELAAGLDDALGGRGRLFLLIGEPGIGKSRLAEEVCDRARARGALVLVGRCWEASGAPAYWPWLQALRGYLRDTDPGVLGRQLGAGASEVAQILPELHSILPGLGGPASVDAEAARFRSFDATVEFFRNAAHDRPLLLFLDDLHAADAPSLLLLQFLAREVRSMRVLVIGACRDVDPVPGRQLAAMLAEVGREPATTRLALRGLSEDAVGEYIAATAGAPDSPDLAATLYEETEGNPFFLGETVRLLAVEGGFAIPQSVRDVIERRLSHLGEECNRLLVLASVLGREFELAALVRMGAVGEDELLETLDEALAARVVTDVPGAPNRLRFAHVLIRDTLYDALSTARRVRLHRLAVEALEDLYGEESGPHLAELAHHATAGSDFAKALVCARQAGGLALSQLAFEEAARLLRAALDSLELAQPGDDRQRCELLLSLGEAEIRAGNSAASKEVFLQAAGIARTLSLSRELARAAAGYGGRIVYARAGSDRRLVPLLEEALAAVGDEDIELRVRLLARLAGALRDEPRRDRRDSLSREAVELARRTGDDSALAYALDGRAAAIFGPDTVEECVALGTDLCEVAARIDDPERVGYGHIHRFIALLQAGEIAAAEAALAAAQALTTEHRQASHLWQVVAGQAMVAIAKGRLAEGEELSRHAREIGERALPWLAVPVSVLQHYTLCEFRGTVSQTEAVVHGLMIDYPARPVFRCVLAHLSAGGGRAAEAAAILDALAGDAFTAIPFDMEWSFSMSLLAEVSAALRDTASATVLHGLLVPWGNLVVVNMAEGIRGTLSRYLGLLATTLGRWDEAAERFEFACAENERMGYLPWLARTQQDYAVMLRRRGTPARDARAARLEGEAQALCEALGIVVSSPLAV